MNIYIKDQAASLVKNYDRYLSIVSG
jgi:hypothetical protein